MASSSPTTTTTTTPPAEVYTCHSIRSRPPLYRHLSLCHICHTFNFLPLGFLPPGFLPPSFLIALQDPTCYDYTRLAPELTSAPHEHPIDHTRLPSEHSRCSQCRHKIADCEAGCRTWRLYRFWSCWACGFQENPAWASYCHGRGKGEWGACGYLAETGGIVGRWRLERSMQEWKEDEIAVRWLRNWG